MAERMDDTKAIKRKFDDETVEQLVENRFVSDKKASHKPKRKAKKKKNYALSVLITILAFVLVFVVFFIGSYIVFTASPQNVEDEIKVTDSKNNKKNEDLAKDYEKEELPAPENEKEDKEDKSLDDGALMKEDDLDVKPSSKKENKVEDEKKASDYDDEDEKKAPSSSESEDIKKTQVTTKPQAQTKPHTQPSPKPSAPAEDKKPSSDVVKKNEQSEAIILE